MMKLILISTYLLTATIAVAQNLVPNPGFDINNSCPNQIGQIDKADGWSVWGGTPDYFHSCSNATFPTYGVPVNVRGFQVPHSGDAYVGLFTFSSLNANFREYVGRPLSTPLTVGTTYFISFFINHADVNVVSHATNNIGVKFSTVPYSLVNPDTALDNAHVFLTTVVSDTANWVFVSGSFVTDSAYSHIGIGNYFSDAATTIAFGSSGANYAYYLIDDICVSADQEQCDISSGVTDDNDNAGIMVYPNPSNGSFHIITSRNTEGMLTVFDITGREQLKEKIDLQKNQNTKIDLSNFAEGIYFVRIVNEKILLSEKLVIRK